MMRLLMQRKAKIEGSSLWVRWPEWGDWKDKKSQRN